MQRLDAPVAVRPRPSTKGAGAVATAHPLATEAGIAVLERGGNAVDAANAAAAVLGVVQPMMSGLGGDTFMLVYEARERRVHAIQGAGPAPLALDPQRVAQLPGGRLPDRGLLSAAVPGAPGAMWLAHRRFGSGRLSMPALLARAIELAADGAPVAPAVARFFKVNQALLAASPTAALSLLVDGAAPAAGTIVRQPELARTLEQLGAGPEHFYRGAFAEQLLAYSRAVDGAFCAEDLGAYAPELCEPIATAYGQHRVLSNPPVAQGVVLLQALGILQRHRAARGQDAAEDAGLKAHRMIESLKLAFRQRNRRFGDPRFVPDATAEVLSDVVLAAQAARISDAQALVAEREGRWSFGEGDTTALVTADAQGNVVSCITSLSTPFGSAEVVPGTGVLMNNRVGRGFSLDPRAPNCLAGGKRTMSTLHAYLACDADGAPVLAGCTSGGDGQPQWNLQMLDAVLQDGLGVRDAVAMPRWELSPGTDPASLDQPYEILVDPRLDAALVQGLRDRGHTISSKPLGMLGAAQMLSIAPDGAIAAAADPRADGTALVLA